MMKISSFILTSLGLASLLAACTTATTTVIPMDNGTYQAVTTARNTADAQQDSIQKATDTCQQQNKKLAVIGSRTQYQGSNKELGSITEAMSQASFMNKGPFIPSSETNQDYRTITEFKCE